MDDPRHAAPPGVVRSAADSGRSMITTRKTSTGRGLTEADLDALAEEVESATMALRRCEGAATGRPAMGSGLAEVVHVRSRAEHAR